MGVIEFFTKCLDDANQSLVRSVQGLSTQELSWQPQPDCNSIGFLVWHCARVLDNWFQSRIKGVPQLWEEGWAEKLQRAPADASDIGFQFTAELLQSFQVPDTSALLAYVEAVHASTVTYLKGVDDTALENVTVGLRGSGTMPLVTLLEQLVWELNQHGGQIAYLKGMQQGLDPSFRGPALEAAYARGS